MKSQGVLTFLGGAFIGMLAGFLFLTLAWVLSVGMFVELIYGVLRFVFGDFPAVGFFTSLAVIGGTIALFRARSIF